ncbi:MAG: two component regulator propeller domain protein [Chlorobi bacterium]|nr:two component regulator propeller domain protein [Chlorobiota bacterium]
MDSGAVRIAHKRNPMNMRAFLPILLMFAGAFSAVAQPRIPLAGNRPAETSPWKVYGPSNSPLPTFFRFVLDRDRSVGWFGTGTTVTSFDGSTWTTHDWPATGRLCGMAIDSSGDLWGAISGEHTSIVRSHRGVWTTFDGTDTTTGLTKQMLIALGLTLDVGRVQAGPNGHLWVMGPGALLHFDGARWRMFTPGNSKFPPDPYAHIVDRQGNVWIGKSTGGLLKFDGTSWTEIHPDQLGLGAHGTDHTGTFPVSVDHRNHLWVRVAATDGDQFLEFEGDKPIHAYAGDSSELAWGTPHFDAGNEPWIGSYRGLARYHAAAWWKYTTANSGLPDDNVTAVDIDNGHIGWIVTGDAMLAMLDGNVPPGEGIAGITPNPMPITVRNISMEILPNPARGISTVGFMLSERERVRLSLVNSLGDEVQVMIDGVIEPGEHAARLDAGGLANGAYFVRISTGAAVVTKPVVIVH